MCALGQRLLPGLSFSWSVGGEEVTNPPGFSTTPAGSWRELSRELSFGIQHKPNANQWEEE